MKIKLNNKVEMDLKQLIDSRLLIQANSGGGKSHLIRRILEQTYGEVQQIVLDPEGEFGTLREKYDYILAGKGADVPAEPRTAAILAKKLLELGTSAIIDLYELSPQDRKRFVRLFLEAMVNAPKELWHPVLVVIDEAHVFAPEKDQSEAASAVIDLATRGRKRGFCAVLATQRISKLAKDAAAECNNKLIGRSSIDIDMKRAGDELGFTSREQLFSLRKLQPGQFFGFGPAISDEVIEVQVGDVKTSHPKAGSRSLTKVPPPTEGVKKILGQLADLPKEAEEEAKTIREYKAQVTDLKRQLTIANEKLAKPRGEPTRIKTIEKPVVGKRTLEKLMKALAAMKKIDKHVFDAYKAIEPQVRLVETYMSQFEENLKRVQHPMFLVDKAASILPEDIKPGRIIMPQPPVKITRSNEFETPAQESGKFGLCEKKIYSFLYENSDKGFTKIQIAAVTGYSPKSSGFQNAMAKLNAAGIIRKSGDKVFLNAKQEGLYLMGERFSAAPVFWNNKLGQCERKIYEFLWDHPNVGYPKDQIAEATGYSAASSGFQNATARLNSIGLIRRMSSGQLEINPDIKDL